MQPAIEMHAASWKWEGLLKPRGLAAVAVAVAELYCGASSGMHAVSLRMSLTTSSSAYHHDGLEISFVKQPPRELQLECSICLQLLTDPSVIGCDCGSSFCNPCIESVKRRKNPCPLCQQKFTTILPNKQLQRTLNGLTIHCPHRGDGCSWMDELGKLKQHFNRMPSNETRLEGCGFTDVLCQYCKKFIPRKDIPTHETETCPKKPYTCQYCSHSSVLDDIRENHWPVCPHFPVPCPYECGEIPQRQGLEIHMEKKCLQAPVTCDFRYAGCEVELSRRDMANHLRYSIVDHMSLMSLKHREEVSALKEENQLIKQECADLKAGFEAEVLLLKIESGQKLNDSLADVRRETSETQSEPSQAAALCVQPPLLVELLVTRIKQLRRRRVEWTSEPFYSRCGYKMVLGVYPYGNQGGYGTHLSLYIYIIQGEHDHQLNWPFIGTVTISLVDQKLGRNRMDTLCYTRENSQDGARRYNSTLTNGWGWEKFVELNYLSSYYLKDNCLVFQINDIKYQYSW